MVMKSAHVESYTFHIGTDLAKMHFGQISTNMKCIEILYMRHFVNRCRELPLENVTAWSTKAKCYGTWNLWLRATESSFVPLNNKLAIATMDQRTAVSIT
jgi:hypothetical protein